MVLGHEGVFCWGGPEQRAVHKGCGMEKAGRRWHWRDKYRKTTPRKRLPKRHRVAACASTKGSKTNVKDVCCKEANEA